jgi:hypothetical protein
MWSTIINAPLEEMVKKFLLVIPNIAGKANGTAIPDPALLFDN